MDTSFVTGRNIAIFLGVGAGVSALAAAIRWAMSTTTAVVNTKP